MKNAMTLPWFRSLLVEDALERIHLGRPVPLTAIRLGDLKVIDQHLVVLLVLFLADIHDIVLSRSRHRY